MHFRVVLPLVQEILKKVTRSFELSKILLFLWYVLIISATVLYTQSSIFGYFLLFLLTSTIYASAKNINIRSLLLIATFGLVCSYLLTDTISHTLVTIDFTEFEYGYVYRSLIFDVSLLFCLTGIRYLVFFRNELANMVRSWLDLSSERYEILMADTWLVRFFDAYRSVFCIAVSYIYYLYYNYYTTLTTDPITAEQTLEKIMTTSGMFYMMMGMIYGSIPVLLILTLTAFAQKVDVRWSGDRTGQVQ